MHRICYSTNHTDGSRCCEGCERSCSRGRCLDPRIRCPILSEKLKQNLMQVAKCTRSKFIASLKARVKNSRENWQFMSYGWTDDNCFSNLNIVLCIAFAIRCV